jgi:hypothetical protein
VARHGVPEHEKTRHWSDAPPAQDYSAASTSLAATMLGLVTIRCATP